MGAVFVIKQNDRQPYLYATLLQADGAPVDLTGATVKFVMQKQDGTALKVNADAIIINAPEGTVEYRWAAGDTDTPGNYRAEFKVLFAGSQMTVPNAEYITVRIEKGLG